MNLAVAVVREDGTAHSSAPRAIPAGRMTVGRGMTLDARPLPAYRGCERFAVRVSGRWRAVRLTPGSIALWGVARAIVDAFDDLVVADHAFGSGLVFVDHPSV
jgi:hypothetical protein